MHIVVLAWTYVVLMMAITEDSVTAGIMTFLLYAVLPLTIILYVGGAGKRKRRRAEAEELRADQALANPQPTETSAADAASPPRPQG